jgi:hypothetical protein
MRVLEYRWPCGCKASGVDDAALDVTCCRLHADLLAAAMSSHSA